METAPSPGSTRAYPSRPTHIDGGSHEKVPEPRPIGTHDGRSSYLGEGGGADRTPLGLRDRSVEIELLAEEAPITFNNFLYLAQGGVLPRSDLIALMV